MKKCIHTPIHLINLEQAYSFLLFTKWTVLMLGTERLSVMIGDSQRPDMSFEAKCKDHCGGCRELVNYFIIELQVVITMKCEKSDGQGYASDPPPRIPIWRTFHFHHRNVCYISRCIKYSRAVSSSSFVLLILGWMWVCVCVWQECKHSNYIPISL